MRIEVERDIRRREYVIILRADYTEIDDALRDRNPLRGRDNPGFEAVITALQEILRHARPDGETATTATVVPRANGEYLVRLPCPTCQHVFSATLLPPARRLSEDGYRITIACAHCFAEYTYELRGLGADCYASLVTDAPRSISPEAAGELMRQVVELVCPACGTETIRECAVPVPGGITVEYDCSCGNAHMARRVVHDGMRVRVGPQAISADAAIAAYQRAHSPRIPARYSGTETTVQVVFTCRECGRTGTRDEVIWVPGGALVEYECPCGTQTYRVVEHDGQHVHIGNPAASADEAMCRMPAHPPASGSVPDVPARPRRRLILD